LKSFSVIQVCCCPNPFPRTLSQIIAAVEQQTRTATLAICLKDVVFGGESYSDVKIGSELWVQQYRASVPGPTPGHVQLSEAHDVSASGQ
jgi:hypothetical protein